MQIRSLVETAANGQAGSAVTITATVPANYVSPTKQFTKEFDNLDSSNRSKVLDKSLLIDYQD